MHEQYPGNTICHVFGRFSVVCNTLPRDMLSPFPRGGVLTLVPINKAEIPLKVIWVYKSIYSRP